MLSCFWSFILSWGMWRVLELLPRRSYYWSNLGPRNRRHNLLRLWYPCVGISGDRRTVNEKDEKILWWMMVGGECLWRYGWGWWCKFCSRRDISFFFFFFRNEIKQQCRTLDIYTHIVLEGEGRDVPLYLRLWALQHQLQNFGWIDQSVNFTL